MIRVGLTGPTGAGKTTVLQGFEELGFVTIDCDELYHLLLETSAELVKELTDRFGGSILNSQGKLDRKALGRVVFGDEVALSDLNAISHRYVRAACQAMTRQAEEQGAVGVVYDAIALWESGLAEGCNVTVAVIAPEEVRLKRIMARDGIDEAYARSRIAAQKGNEFFTDRCAFTIVNDGSISQQALKEQVKSDFSQLLLR